MSELVWALTTGDLDEVKAKLPCEDVNKVVQAGRMPLHFAADYGQTDVVEYLISIGANVNANDVHGFSPLFYACCENHLSCVKVLLEKGADKEQKTEDGRSPFDMAEKEDIKALRK